MQSRPFENERERAAAHISLHDFEGVDVHLYFITLINGMEMGRRVVAIKHSNDDSVKSAEFGHMFCQPKNAACTAFIAFSPMARSMMTEIFISLVEIMPMFTPSLAST